MLSAVKIFLKSRSENTKRSYLAVMRELKDFCKKNLLEINQKDIIKYNFFLKNKTGIKPRKGSNYALSGATIRQRIDVIRSLYNHLHSMGLIDINPVIASGIRNTNPEQNRKRPTEMIPFDKVQELINLPSDRSFEDIRERAILSILFAGGLRKSELLNLKIGDIEVSPQGTMFLVLRDTKAGIEQKQALPEWCSERVTRYISILHHANLDNESYLLHKKYTQGKIKIDVRTFDRRFKKYIAKVGLDPKFFSPHCARATAITKLLSEGYSHFAVKNFSRHASIAQVEKYDKRRIGVDESLGKKIKY